jgi:3-oxoacid CoA-transferase subunit A
MTIMLGGFGLLEFLRISIAQLVKIEVTDLTCISNNAGVDDLIGITSSKKATVISCREKCRIERQMLSEN